MTVRDIAATGIWGPAPGDLAGDVVARMTEAGFDAAPVMEAPVWRYVTREALASAASSVPISEEASSISATELVTASLPLVDAIQLLGKRDWFFVIEGHEVRGILTVADLQSLTVGVVVLGFVLAAEVGINALINRHLHTGWPDLLTEDRLAKVNDAFLERKARNSEIDRLSCLNLDDRLTILCKSAELGSAIGICGKQLRRTSKALKQLRNSLAHGDSIVDVGNDPREGIRCAEIARAFADRVWEVVARPG